MAEAEVLDGNPGAAPPPARRRRSSRGRILRVTGLVFVATAVALGGYVWCTL